MTTITITAAKMKLYYTHYYRKTCLLTLHNPKDSKLDSLETWHENARCRL